MKLSRISSLPKSVKLPTSKSLANRWLILQALYTDQVQVHVSDKSDDIEVLNKALSSSESHFDVGHAGTAMRFLTAFLAQKNGGQFVLTGSERMQLRPIKPLEKCLQCIPEN